MSDRHEQLQEFAERQTYEWHGEQRTITEIITEMMQAQNEYNLNDGRWYVAANGDTVRWWIGDGEEQCPDCELDMQDEWDAANRQINDEADRLYAQVRGITPEQQTFRWHGEWRTLEEIVQEVAIAQGRRTAFDNLLQLDSASSYSRDENATLFWWIDENGQERRAVQRHDGYVIRQSTEACTYTNGLINGRTLEEHCHYLLEEVYPQLLESQENDRYQHEQAEEKANALLLEHLDERQTRDWEREHKFSLTAKSGHVYTIHRFGSQPVLRDDGHNYCIQSAMLDIPSPDVCLARKLLLEADEERFLEIANDLTEYQRTPLHERSNIDNNPFQPIEITLDNDDVVYTNGWVRFVGEGIVDRVMTIDDMGHPVWHFGSPVVIDY